MKDEAARQGRPASNVTNRARSVAGAAADNGDTDSRRAAFLRLHAHLQPRSGRRLHFDETHRGVAA
jgi:hypothetical protein